MFELVLTAAAVILIWSVVTLLRCRRRTAHNARVEVVDGGYAPRTELSEDSVRLAGVDALTSGVVSTAGLTW